MKKLKRIFIDSFRENILKGVFAWVIGLAVLRVIIFIFQIVLEGFFNLGLL